jgi:hypothetical protein
MKVCTDKLNRHSDPKNCGKLHVNESVETTVTATCLSVACLDLKTYHIQRKSLIIKPAAKYKHHNFIQMIMEYCSIDKGNVEIECILYVMKFSCRYTITI